MKKIFRIIKCINNRMIGAESGYIFSKGGCRGVYCLLAHAANFIYNAVGAAC